MWYTRKNKPVIKFTLFRLLLLCFLCSLFLGCGSSSSPEDRQDQDSGSSLPEREPWEGIYTANRRVLEGRWSESLFPEQEWEETKDCIMFLTKDTFAKYYPDPPEYIEIENETWQVFPIACEWTTLDEDTAQKIDSEWLELLPVDYRLQHADFFDLDFRCTDYIGCQVLIIDQTEIHNDVPKEPTDTSPPLAWGYRIFTGDNKIFNINFGGVEEESLIPFPTLFGISIFGF